MSGTGFLTYSLLKYTEILWQNLEKSADSSFTITGFLKKSGKVPTSFAGQLPNVLFSEIFQAKCVCVSEYRDVQYSWALTPASVL